MAKIHQLSDVNKVLAWPLTVAYNFKKYFPNSSTSMLLSLQTIETSWNWVNLSFIFGSSFQYFTIISSSFKFVQVRFVYLLSHENRQQHSAMPLKNAVLCWFYDGRKNYIVKVFTYAVFLFRFYSVVNNSWKI